jgi:hypothetical protein
MLFIIAQNVNEIQILIINTKHVSLIVFILYVVDKKFYRH